MESEVGVGLNQSCATSRRRSPDPSPTGAAACRPAEPDGSPRGENPPDTAASFVAPEPHFPRLMTGSVQVSSKRVKSTSPPMWPVLLTTSALLEANRDFCSRLSRRLLACGSWETEQAEWPLARDCCSPCQRSSRVGSIALVVDAATAPPEADSPRPQSPRAFGARANADQGSRLCHARVARPAPERPAHSGVPPGSSGQRAADMLGAGSVRRSASDTVAELSRLARRVKRRVAVAARRGAGIALRRCGRSRSRATKEGKSMQADEAQAFGKLAGEARAGTVSLVEELDQAVFTRSVATASPATKDDWRRRRGGCLCGGWGRLSRTQSRRRRGACARLGGRERSPSPGGEVRPRARADARGVCAGRACARIVEGASR